MDWFIQSTMQLHPESTKQLVCMMWEPLIAYRYSAGSYYPYSRSPPPPPRLKGFSQIILCVLLSHVIKLLNIAWKSFLGT